MNNIDFTQLRITKELRDRIKDYAQMEGRTMEWVVTEAIEDFMAPKRPIEPRKIYGSPESLHPKSEPRVIYEGEIE